MSIRPGFGPPPLPPRASFAAHSSPRRRMNRGARGCESRHVRDGRTLAPDPSSGGRARQSRRQGHRLRGRHRADPVPVLPARPGDDDRLRPGDVDRALRPHPDGRAVDPEAARILGLPDRAPGRDHSQARAQHLDHAAHPVARRRGADLGRLHHRRLRPPGDGRGLPDRHHRLFDSGHDQLSRHHQGRDPYRGSRRALHPRRHPRQADGDRRRPVGGAHRREDRPKAPARARRGKRLLRLDGRRVEIRARRCDRRHHHSGRQHLRRHRDRRHAPRPGAVRRGGRVHQTVGRRRPRHPDPGAHHLARRGPSGRQGRHTRLGRQGGDRPAVGLSERPLRRGAADGGARPRAGPAVPALCDAVGPDDFRRRPDPPAPRP